MASILRIVAGSHVKPYRHQPKLSLSGVLPFTKISPEAVIRYWRSPKAWRRAERMAGVVIVVFSEVGKCNHRRLRFLKNETNIAGRLCTSNSLSTGPVLVFVDNTKFMIASH
jgi:hypothetical protein